MTTYYQWGLKISENQKEKLVQAYKKGNIITLKLGYNDLEGDDLFGLTQTQLTKIENAIENKRGVVLKLSKMQVKENVKLGGFLGALLAGLAGTILPKVLPLLGNLASSALGGLAQVGVTKAFGSGFVDGEGLVRKGDGLYLAKQNGRDYTLNRVEQGSGMLLGKNSPFNGIPILGALL